MRNLPVNSLNFEDIKNNLKDFLKGNELYKDFNFEASGISTLVNTLAYQTHYIGYFVKMLLDEAFIDSAHTRQALLSHAKRAAYIPKGRRAAQAEVVLRVNTTLASEPISRSIQIRRGDKFSSANNMQDMRVFNVLDGSMIYTRFVDGNNVQYVSDTIRVYEGTLRTWNFVVDSSVVNQKYVIRDANCDVDTLRVRVRENSSSSEYTEYNLASDITDLNPTSNAFFVSTDENGYYQIFFGGDVFGVEPQNGNAIELTYISTNGESGNGAKEFKYVPLTPTPYTYTVDTSSVSSGGAEPQTIEELRFAIPNHVRRQNRILTAGDAREYLLSEYRNIDSINVWGGETNAQRDYGKLYVSIKPKFSDKLTALSKTQIREEIVKRGFAGIDVVFMDPDFINTSVTLVAKLDLRKTNKTQLEIYNELRNRAMLYNDTYLSKFNNILSDIEMLNFIKNGEPAVSSVFSRKILTKNHSHLHGASTTNEVNFSNALVPGTIFSDSITYGPSPAHIKDDGMGNVSMFNGSGIMLKNIGKVDYEAGRITYVLPAAARITGFEPSTVGVLPFTATPVSPDVETSLNNVVRITSVKVVSA